MAGKKMTKVEKKSKQKSDRQKQRKKREAPKYNRNDLQKRNFDVSAQ